ncbi:nigerythrin [Xiamenia xianingshaonis]|uniref:Rubrerythrin family protein n=1 Tax=Xiamenia xianingshaonis TaxID=2682776 RepID=A0A9E6STV7_9ACTN|nr:rubrerythrin family protein [Xiamenia xianingshaonis]NGM17047.1 rubrerythrin family protein [Eggerthellaceae bacterium zg-893]NHM14984.1 rubrerythrin family protein [Xiamenia xianingshaonis]NHM15510.1 rubrerythrin family protein [Xiamenia xianingshaonis]QTU83828.1 rubrerythrin family protein [Xiamenia xianingshaonis]
MKVRETVPTPDNSTNFNQMPDSALVVGTTLDNLKSAIQGETGASAKYAAYAKAAKEQGYDQIARLFEATSAAEQIHINLEYGLVAEEEPDFVKPTAEAPEAHQSDLNLIDGAKGEIFETSDMYPAFIKVAQEEGKTKAVQVFTRAKLAESVHAERYLAAYNDLDAADDDAFYLCPVCGYIHKGDDFEKCPICFAPKASFRQF